MIAEPSRCKRCTCVCMFERTIFWAAGESIDAGNRFWQGKLARMENDRITLKQLAQRTHTRAHAHKHTEKGKLLTSTDQRCDNS
eukprot:51397-Pelagomonas_calceolata.AAC.4